MRRTTQFLLTLLVLLTLARSATNQDAAPTTVNTKKAQSKSQSQPTTTTEDPLIDPLAPFIPDEPQKETPQVRMRVQVDFLSVVGFIFACIFVMIAAGGGIGGGGVLVPTYIFMLQLKPKVAIPLSNITIFGASIANCALNYKKRHPYADRPMIDWDLILVMEPLTIAGAVIGSIINVLLPPWLLTMMLIILLALTAYRTLNKGVKLFHKESQHLAAQEPQRSIANERGEIVPLVPPRSNGIESSSVQTGASSYGTNIASRPISLKQPTSFNQQRLDVIYDEERTHPAKKILFLVVLQFGVLALTIFKGGADLNPLGMECGSVIYWVMSLGVLPYVLLFSWFARKILVERYHEKQNFGYEYVRGDVRWDERNTIVYPLICSIAGLCAGLFGIGGGIVKGPLMLEMGVLPEVSSATSATMILLTSSAATISYFIFSALNVYYAAWLFPIGLIFTVGGQIGVDYLVKKWGRPSLIVFVIGTVVAMSAIAMGVEGGKSLILLFQGASEPGRSLCDVIV